MFFHPIQKQQSSYIPSKPKTQSASQNVLLVPFTLSWPIHIYLKDVIECGVKHDMKLRFLLVLSEMEEEQFEFGEERYALLWNLHNRLQGVNVSFSIETAVGPLRETAVQFAEQSELCHVYSTDSSNSENLNFISNAHSLSG